MAFRTATGRPKTAQDKAAIYLGLLAPNLQPNPAPQVVRWLLQQAQDEGLDPQVLYQQAVEGRPAEWPPAPPPQEVLPSQ